MPERKERPEYLNSVEDYITHERIKPPKMT